MVELAEIFRHHGPQYQAKYGDKMLPSHRQAMGAIERCRTPALGGHVYTCEACGETQYQYHSCRNRHCPKCQNAKGQQWLEQQQDMLLPVPHFLVTVTLPSELRLLALRHQKQVYELLFRTSAAAMQHLAGDSRFMGGQMGMVGVLHTWGRNLSYHPHLHCLVPGGALAADEKTWLPARDNFLLPVKALSRIVRASGLGCPLPARWQWGGGAEISSTLHLSRRYQQQPHRQVGRWEGDISLPSFRHRQAHNLYSISQ
jgi:Transposase zinc-binding domain/Putative transposase